MALENFRMFIHEFLNKNTDIVREEVPKFILDCKYYICMPSNGKDTNHTGTFLEE